MKNTFKLLIAVLLFPVVLFAAWETISVFLHILRDFQVAVGLLAGSALYCVIHFGGYRFGRLYVWGHEVTHAIAAMMCGFRVHSMTVNEDNGNVKMDRVNAFVALAPYIIPFYALATGLVYVGLDFFTDVKPYRPAFVFAIGFFMAFHFVQTFQTLCETDQPDLQAAGGRIFSGVVIILCNAFWLLLVLKWLFPDQVLLLTAGKNVLINSYHAWGFVISYGVDWIQQWWTKS